MTEQLIGKQFFLQGAAVDCKEWFFRAATLQVDIACEQFLAGAAFAGDEDVAVGGCNLPCRLQQSLHGGILGDDAGSAVAVIHLVAQLPVFTSQVCTFHGIGDDLADLVEAKRFGDVVVGAGAHGGDRGAQGGVAGDQYHRGIRIEFQGAVQDSHAVDVFHAHVGQHHVEAVVLQCLDAAGAGGARCYRVTGVAERMGQVLYGDCLVIDDQQVAAVAGIGTHVGRSLRGSRMVMRVPLAGRVLTAMQPPCSWMIS